MIFTVLAAVVLASASPDSRLAALQSAAAFHIYVMPDSAEVQHVDVLASDVQGHPTDVRIVYRLSQETLIIEETARADNATSAQSFGPDALFVNGYPATYSRSGPYFRQVGHLTWSPSGVNIQLSSMDLVDVPALVNAALSLR
jgi:hypothetical protein